jgi:hypothetical protein
LNNGKSLRFRNSKIESFLFFDALRNRSKGHGKAKPSEAALEYYSKERELATEMGLKWRERGPRNEDGTSNVPFFRGQRWREGSMRFANRGGKKRVYHAEYHRAVQLGFSEADARKRATEAQALVDNAQQGQQQEQQHNE